MPNGTCSHTHARNIVTLCTALYRSWRCRRLCTGPCCIIRRERIMLGSPEHRLLAQPKVVQPRVVQPKEVKPEVLRHRRRTLPLCCPDPGARTLSPILRGFCADGEGAYTEGKWVWQAWRLCASARCRRASSSSSVGDSQGCPPAP